MSRQQLFDEIVRLLAQVGLDNTVTIETPIRTVGLDSLYEIEAIMCVEEEFNIELPDERLEQLVTAGDFVDLVQEQLALPKDPEVLKATDCKQPGMVLEHELCHDGRVVARLFSDKELLDNDAWHKLVGLTEAAPEMHQALVDIIRKVWAIAQGPLQDRAQIQLELEELRMIAAKARPSCMLSDSL
jgi:acyl carrier protein